ncbi:hypothetical protein AAC387_Pa04g1515 [Persea americana]
MHLAKQRKGNNEQNKEDQVTRESSLFKLVGVADMYNLEKLENLHPAQEKQLPRHSSVGVTSSNVSSGVAIWNKTRIRWTQDLHERFVESLEELGAAKKTRCSCC